MRIALPLLLFASIVTAQSPLHSGVQPGTTAFLGNTVVTNTNPTPVTELFDVTVTDPNGITITRFECNVNTSAGTTGTLTVFVTPAGVSHVGNQANAAAWTQKATQTIQHSGGRVSFVLPTPFYLAPGTYGMALNYDGANPIYSNPTTQTPPLGGTYVNTEATFDCTTARVRAVPAGLPFGGTAAGFAPRHPNIAMHYLIGAVSVDFAGTPLRGASPLPVQFTSYAVSGNPGGILAYIWDFDGDGVADSSLPNPAHVYTQCGSYNVSLTIVDGTGSYNATKQAYVVTDVIVPGFTTAMISPNTIQFTDTSSPVPQTWAWDLDGDGITDSTAQNPVWNYGSACSEAVVTQITTLACQPAVTLQKRIAVANAAETISQGGLVISAAATGGTNFLDVVVTNPQGITVCGLHSRNNATASTPLTYVVWQKSGTYVGNVTTAGVWRQVASEQVLAGGPGTRTFVPLTTPLYLAAGAHALGIQVIGASPTYTNLGGLQTYTTPDVAITTGMTMGDPIFAGTQYNPRVWNGALYYSTSALTGAGGYGYIGDGCAGTLGVPGNVATSQPRLGTTMSAVVDKLPIDVAFFVIGFSRTASPLGALPIDLGPFGAPSCSGRVSPDATIVLLGSSGSATWNFAVPNGAGLVGIQFFTQAFAIDPGHNALGGVMSDAAALLVGN